MKPRADRQTTKSQWVAGFSLVEALVSVALMSLVVAGLSAVTGQWTPNWNRGFVRVQRAELLDFGLQRLVSDLEASEFVTANVASKTAIFVGDAKSVTLVRAANAPGAPTRLEFVRLAETVDERGFAMVRSHAPFRPLDPNLPFDAQLYFTDPVVLVRGPHRVSFAFAGADRIWRDSWRNEVLLPTAARIQVRNAVTDEVLADSTAALVHADLPAECIAQHSFQECIEGMRPPAHPPNDQGQPAGNPP